MRLRHVKRLYDCVVISLVVIVKHFDVFFYTLAMQMFILMTIARLTRDRDVRAYKRAMKNANSWN
jgi:hypothetical protein